ncbi:MAG: hypothetical protein M1833_001005 [Piccolia ochrophora]|nr:MAG: hypothetical protein M1833_001005 [Piccolia ochrophora]
MARFDRSKSLILVIFVLLGYIFYEQLDKTTPRVVPEEVVKPMGDQVVDQDKPLKPTAKPPAVPQGEAPPSRAPATSKSGMKIAVASMNTHENSFDHIALSNKDYYAKKNDYDFKFDYEGDGFWHKFKMVENIVAEQKYDWIWWLDFDALITNTTVKLEDIIHEALEGHKDPDSVDMILTPDCFPLNAGSMLFRGHTRLLEFVNRCWDCRRAPTNPSEQDCMLKLIDANEHGEKDKAVFIPQWKMNAFPEEVPCFDQTGKGWEPGMFVVHFAGAWAHMQNSTDAKGELMSKYSLEIIR